MIQGKTAESYRYVDKKPAELSPEYPKWITHPLGHRVLVNTAEEEAVHLAHPAKVENDAPAPLAVPGTAAAPAPAEPSHGTPSPVPVIPVVPGTGVE